MLKLTQQELTLDAAGPDGMPRRTLAGLALPYNVQATVSDGTKVMFMPGSLDAGGKSAGPEQMECEVNLNGD